MSLLKRPRVAALANWLLFSFTITVNALANILPINGLNTGQVSALYPNRFVPDGATFSIWSLIYAWLLAFMIYATYHLFRKPEAGSGRLALTVSPWFQLSCLLNAAWMVTWHYLQPGISLLLMLALLVCLLRIFLQTVPDRPSFSTAARWLIVTPFVIYLAWICVATIANTTAMLVHLNWNGLGVAPEYWASVMVVIAALLACWMVFHWHQAAFALVVAWALWGVYRGQSADSAVTAQTSVAAIGGCLLAVIFLYIRRFRKAEVS